MARRPREEVAGGTYHVTARGNNGAEIFRDDYDRIYLLGLLSHAAAELDWRCFAYCLMSNHYHVLVRTPRLNLSSGMRLIQTRHARRFNSRHGRRGHLFGDRFHSRRVEEDSHLLAAASYIVLNPVRAGLVERPDDWRWSSYRATAGLDDAPGLLDVEPLLEMLAADRDSARWRYVEMVEAMRCPQSTVTVTTPR